MNDEKVAPFRTQREIVNRTSVCGRDDGASLTWRCSTAYI